MTDRRRGTGSSDVGAILRARRVAAGLTQQQLAGRAEVSVGALRDIEQGRTAFSRPETLKRLAAAMELKGRDREELTSAAGTGARASTARPPGQFAVGGTGNDLWLAMLGPVVAWRNETPVALGPVRQRAVLALLVLHTGPVSRAAIIDALWGSDPPSAAVEMVHHYISRIRRLLGSAPGGRDGERQPGAGVLSWDGTGYGLAAGVVRSDATEFGVLAERARRAHGAGEPAAAGELYEQALRLWRGAPLAGMELLRDHPAVIELARRRAEAVIDYSHAAAALGKYDVVLGYLRALADEDLLDERVHARLMIVLSAVGQQAAAVRLYESLRRRLNDELGVQPGPELAEAHLRILRQELPAPVRSARPLDAATAATGAQETTHRPTAGRVVAPRQLPPAPPYFAGRAAELSALEDMRGQADHGPGTVLITAICGGAGVGKTALALHWAHRVASRFPDGQLYLNLRGYGPSRRPVGADEAISILLDALQVPPERVPLTLDARVGLYRSLLAGKRMLLVLDNARSADQLRPLLPGSAECVVVVTSRSQLAGLAAQGAWPLLLDNLTHADARAMLTARLGARQSDPDDAADELIELCARLPLALSVTAARAARHPGSPLAAIAADLRDEQRRLDALDTSDAATSVRAVFSWSYRLLSRPAARLFRLLGVYPGYDITGPAAGSLAGIPQAQALRVLGELADSSMLTEHLPGRFACHDLLRLFAAQQAQAAESDADRRAALHRVLGYYLHTCFAADRLMDASRDPITLATLPPGVRPEGFADPAAARAWCQAEYPALASAITHAANFGLSRYAWQLAWAADTFLHRQARWTDNVAMQGVALAAAQRERDRAGEAHIRSGLGRAHAMLESFEVAQHQLSEAVSLFQRLQDQGGEATARIRLGLVAARHARHAEARAHARRALKLYQRTANLTGQAGALNNIGWYTIQLGQPEQALASCQQALQIFRELGDRRGQGIAHNSIAVAQLRLGNQNQGLTHSRASTGLLAADETYELADALDSLGDAHHAVGDSYAALQAWQEALDVIGPAQQPAATRIRSKLRHIR
jgi:DNA-binding SARP family transcriptional activator